MRCNVVWFRGYGGMVLAAVCTACAGESSMPAPVDGDSSSLPSGSSTSTSVTGLTESAAADSRSAPSSGSTAASSSKSDGTSGSSASTLQSTATDDSELEGSAHSSTASDNEPSTSATTTASPGAIEALAEYLEQPRTDRGDLAAEAFASLPLSAEQANEAHTLLWADHKAWIEQTRQQEHAAKAITIDGQTLKYDFTVFGEPKPSGRSLVLSLHGGGEAEASVNDEQWENQKVLYTLDEGIYLSPRAPTNTWNLWHEAHIDPLFERLIENFIALEGVDPNRVYVMGYSAGGDGVYQLGPRMADHWAAASAIAPSGFE